MALRCIASSFGIDIVAGGTDVDLCAPHLLNVETLLRTEKSQEKTNTWKTNIVHASQNFSELVICKAEAAAAHVAPVRRKANN